MRTENFSPNPDGPRGRRQPTGQPVDLCGNPMEGGDVRENKPDSRLKNPDYVARHGDWGDGDFTGPGRAALEASARDFATGRTEGDRPVVVATSSAERHERTAEVYATALGGAAVVRVEALDDEMEVLVNPEHWKAQVNTQLGEAVAQSEPADVLAVTSAPHVRVLAGLPKNAPVPNAEVMPARHADEQ